MLLDPPRHIVKYRNRQHKARRYLYYLEEPHCACTPTSASSLTVTGQIAELKLSVEKLSELTNAPWPLGRTPRQADVAMEHRVQNDNHQFKNVHISGSAKANFGDTHHHYGNAESRLCKEFALVLA